MSLQAVIFDFDGVIADTESLHYRSINQALIEVFGGKGIGMDEYYVDYIGFDDRGVFQEFYARKCRILDAVQQQKLIKRKAELFGQAVKDGVYLYNGVERLIHELCGNNMPLGLCSGAYRGDIMPVLECYNLQNCFDVMSTADDVSVSKPSPIPYLDVIERLNRRLLSLTIEARRAWAIEDTPAGLRSASAAGLKTLAVLNTHEEMAVSFADVKVASLEHVRAAVPVRMDGDAMSELEGEWCRRVVVGGVGVTFLWVMSCFADPLPFAFEDAPKSPPRDDFFALETVVFGDEVVENSVDTDTHERRMALQPEWMGKYTTLKKQSMAQECQKEAEEYILKQQWGLASEAIEEALQRDPDNISLMGKAAMIFAMDGQYAQASALFRLFLQHYPDQVPYLVGWSGVLIRQGDIKTAEQLLARADALAPSGVAAQYQQAILDRINGGERCWDGWKTLPMDQVYEVVGWLLHERSVLVKLLGRTGFMLLCDCIVGRGAMADLAYVKTLLEKSRERVLPEEELTLYQHMRAAGVESVWIDYNLARIYYEMGRPQDADELLKELQVSFPNEFYVWFHSGLLSLQINDYAVAEGYFKRALHVQESGDAFFGLACAYAGLQRYNEAWGLIRQLNRSDPAYLRQLLEGNDEYLLNMKEHPDFERVIRF